MLKVVKTINYTPLGKIYEEIPRMQFSDIVLRISSLSFTGGTTPALVANTIFSELALSASVGGKSKKLENLGGHAWDGYVPTGINMKREFLYHKTKRALADNKYRLGLEDRYPADIQFILEGRFSAIAACSTGSPTAITCSIEICLETEGDPFPAGILMRKMDWGRKDIASTTKGEFPILLGSERPFMATHIIFDLEALGVRANDVVSSMEIEYKGVSLTKGTFTQLQDNWSEYSESSCNTGMLIYKFEKPLDISPNSLIIKYESVSAANKAINYMLVQYTVL